MSNNPNSSVSSGKSGAKASNKKSIKPKSMGHQTSARDGGNPTTSPIPEIGWLYLPSHNKGSNFVRWKENLSTYCITHYQESGSFIKTGIKFEPKKSIPENFLDTEGLTGDAKAEAKALNEIIKDSNRESIKLYIQEVSKVKNNMITMYGIIWGQLSDDSKEKIRTTIDDYETWSVALNTESLWKAVIDVHLTAPTGSSAVDQKAARDNYNMLKQRPNESLSAFKERFSAAVVRLEAVGVVEVLQPDQAIDFIFGLDESRFQEAQVQLRNNVNQGITSYPTTLVAALKWAENCVTLRKTAAGPSSMVYCAQQVALPAASRPAPKSETKGNHSATEKTKSDGTKSKNVKHSDKTKPDKTSAAGPKPKTCFFCQQTGHWGNECQLAIQAAAQYQARAGPTPGQQSVNVTASTSTVHTPAYTFNIQVQAAAAFNSAAPSDPKDVLLDNQATVSIFKCPLLLTNIRDAAPEEIVSVKGINGNADLTIDQVGETEDFGTVYYCSQASANVLSLGIVERRNDVDISYTRGKSFLVTFDSGTSYEFVNYQFNPEGGALYACTFPKFRSQKSLVTTVADNEAMHTVAEVKRAKAAQEAIKRAGYPSMAQFLKMINSGALIDCPVTAADLKLCHDIYGPDIASLKGKGKQRKSKPVLDTSIPMAVIQRQSLHADIMFVDREPYLVTVSKPMHLMMVTHLGGSRSALALSKAIKEHLAGYTSRGFMPTMIFSDNEGGIVSIVSELHNAGVAVNLASPGQHVPVVENAIRLIKERVRCIIATLPFKLPRYFMKWLIGFVVGRINMGISRTSGDLTSPREKFLGRKTNYARDMSLCFMQTAEVPITSHQQSNSVYQERRATALALHPTGNLQGSVHFYLLSTQAIVAREHWDVVPMTTEVINTLNKMPSSPSAVSPTGPIITMGTDELPVGEVFAEDNELSAEFALPPPTVIHNREPDNPDDEDAVSIDSDVADSAGAVVVDGQIVQVGETEETLNPDFNYWIDPEPAISHAEDVYDAKRSFLPAAAPIEEVYNLTIIKAIKNYGLAAINAIIEEIGQMINKGVWEGVDISSLTEEQVNGIIRSSFFLKEKFDSQGNFIKIKGRAVAGGDGQDHSIYQESEISSPTCSLGALMMGVAIAAKEHRHVCTVDIGGAYLNADMKADVYMRLDQKLTTVLCLLDPNYRKFVEPRGTVVVKLKKALYGCIESGKLWYDKLTDILSTIGFVQNPYERCIYNLDREGIQITAAVYVDDILLTSKSMDLMEQIVSIDLPRYLPEVKVNRGLVHSFLGMTLDFSTPGKVHITMPNYIGETLDEFGVSGTAATPALAQLFDVRDSPQLPRDRAKDFHRFVAKLLYLPKRCRPDISVATAFLSTRVQCSTEDDWLKLERVMKYLNGTRALGICIQPDPGPINPTALVDASYGVHADGKSHTGCVISLGKGPVYVKSGKQKIVAKSSTEAELVGLSDSIGQIIWSREFLIAQGYDLGVTTVHQDNLSTMALAQNGQSNSERTRHINIRYFFVTDRIASREIELSHLGTSDMIADILTKPLQGNLFRKLRSQLMNWGCVPPSPTHTHGSPITQPEAKFPHIINPNDIAQDTPTGSLFP